MTSLFGTGAPLLSDINLILQIGIFIVLSAGVVSVKRQKFNLHGYVMFSAAALNLLSIAIVMLPAVVSIFSGASQNTFTSITALHSVLGTIAEGLGIYIVGVWRFSSSVASCSRLKTHMRVLAVLWTTTVVLGVTVYILLYT